MTDDLSGQKVWSDIARAYERFIIRTSFYDAMMEEMCNQVGNAKTVLDMGCGVGVLMNKLLKNPNRHVVGVDANKYMLEIAENEIIPMNRLERSELLLADATTFNREEKFDAITTSNVFFNLNEPYSFLDNAYHLLNQGGHLVITSPKHKPNLDLIINTAMREFLEEGKLTKYLKQQGEMVRDINKRFMGVAGGGEHRFQTFDNEELCNILLDFIGFESILCSKETYLSQNFLVTAQKPRVEERIIYKIATTQQELEMVYKLRYYILHDRMGYLKFNSDKKDMSIFDANATTILAVTAQSDKVVGCFTLVYDSDVGLPEVETLAITQELRQKMTIASPYRWIVLPQYRGRNIGKELFRRMYELSKTKGVDFWAFPINPELKSYFIDEMGCVQVGSVQAYHEKTGIPVHARLEEIKTRAFE